MGGSTNDVLCLGTLSDKFLFVLDARLVEINGLLPTDTINANKKLLPDWKPIKVSLFEDPEGKERSKPLGDFMGIVGPAVSHKAKSILEGLISNTVEFLPLDFEEERYYALNITWVDCLDATHSEVELFRSGRIMNVVRYAFKWERLENIHMFYINELGKSRLFVSDILFLL